MTLPHDEATANIFLDGLGICCFNRQNLWEVGYLRDHDHGHELILDIDGHPQMPMTIDDEPGIVIRIKTVGGISPHAQFPKGFFDQGTVRDRRKRPATLDEAENFRWVIDLENPRDIDHGNGHLMKPHGFPVTRTFIEHAVFYTQSLPVKRLHRLLDSEDGEALPDHEFDARLFGRVNNLIGADITCAAIDGAINIVIEKDHGNPETIEPLPHRPGNPWQISLTNMRSTPVETPKRKVDEKGPHRGHYDVMASRGHGRRKGDFQLYYHAFDLDDETRKRALWGFADFVDLRSGRTDCNMAFAGTSPNLDVLF